MVVVVEFLRCLHAELENPTEDQTRASEAGMALVKQSIYIYIYESSFELSRHVANQLREDLKSLSEAQDMMAIVGCQARTAAIPATGEFLV